MSSISWNSYIEECRNQQLPCCPVWDGEPFFSVEYLCANFLLIESIDNFMKKVGEAGIPVMRSAKRPMIRMSDAQKVCMNEQPAKDEDRLPAPVPVPEKTTNPKPRKSPKG
jgi:hypothetical protein